MSWSSAHRILTIAACALFAVAVATTIIPPNAAGTPPRLCFGQAPTIVGTDANDVLVGTNGPDVIVGGEGRDVLRGRGGNDRLCDDAGTGGSPDQQNRLRGGAGDDRVSGGSYVYGGPGDDVLRSRKAPSATSAAVVSFGQAGDDVMHGGAGFETEFLPGVGDDRVYGAPGDELAYVPTTKSIVVDLRTGVAKGMGTDVFSGAIDRVVTGRGDDVLRGTAAPEMFNGTGGDDHVLGRGGDDEIRGEIGDDTLVGGRGASDQLWGGEGRDRCIDDGLRTTFMDCERHHAR